MPTESIRELRGLSPRVRGNRDFGLSPTVYVRSIPARAGEPIAASISISSWAVYPRACGGTISIGTGLMLGRGLSPRVRGNL